MNPKDRVIVAIDTPLGPIARRMVEKLAPYVGGFKLGIIAINAGYAYGLIDVIRSKKKIVFLDGKFCDIPETVACVSCEAAKRGVDWFSIHASAGREAIRQAVLNRLRASVLGVTVLSSQSENECVNIFGAFPGKKVVQFMNMLSDGGAQGIICSPRELHVLSRVAAPKRLIKVAVGIRPRWAESDDQKRIATPSQAIRLGADYLVVGRPITKPPRTVGTSVEAVKLILQEVASAVPYKEDEDGS